MLFELCMMSGGAVYKAVEVVPIPLHPIALFRFMLIFPGPPAFCKKNSGKS